MILMSLLTKGVCADIIPNDSCVALQDRSGHFHAKVQ